MHSELVLLSVQFICQTQTPVSVQPVYEHSVVITFTTHLIHPTEEAAQMSSETF